MDNTKKTLADLHKRSTNKGVGKAVQPSVVTCMHYSRGRNANIPSLVPNF